MASAALCGLLPVPAAGQSLRDALLKALTDSPDVRVAEARARAAREDIRIARSSGLPALDATGEGTSLGGDARYDNGRLPAPAMARSTASLDLRIPLYSGGGVRSAVAAARWRAQAAEAELERTRGDVLTDTLQAYAEAGRDAVIRDLHVANVAMLDDERRRTAAGVRHGDASDTDVRQTEGRLAGARAEFARAESRRTASLEELRRLTGRESERPVDPADLIASPVAATIADAAILDAPQTRAARLAVDAARADVDVARAARRPQLSLSASLGYTYLVGGNALPRFETLDPYAGTRSTIGLRLSIPFYQGGIVGARVRRSEALRFAARERVTEVERRGIARLRAERARLAAAQASIALLESVVSANRDAVRGVRIDRGLGFRSTLEVLNAEQELLAGRIALASARAEAVTSAAVLLNVAGRAADLLPLADRPVKAATARAEAPRLDFASFDLGALPASRITRPGPRLAYDHAALV